jgi:hypothetical protein
MCKHWFFHATKSIYGSLIIIYSFNIYWELQVHYTDKTREKCKTEGKKVREYENTLPCRASNALTYFVYQASLRFDPRVNQKTP